MALALDTVTAPPELKNRSGEGVADTTREFLRRVPLVITEYVPQFFRLGRCGAEPEVELTGHRMKMMK